MPAADTSGTGALRPPPRKKKRQPVPVPRGATGAFGGASSQRPFAGQQQQAARKTEHAQQRLPAPVIAAPPIIPNPTRRQTQVAKAQIVKSIRAAVGPTSGAERVARTDAVLASIHTDPRLSAARASLEHYGRADALLQTREAQLRNLRDRVKPGRAPRVLSAGFGPNVNLTAIGHTLAAATPGLQSGSNPARLVRNSLKDLATIGEAPFVASVGLTGLGVDVATGHPGRAVAKTAAFAKGVAHSTVQEITHPGKAFSEHPLLTALDYAGLASVGGRVAGAVARGAGSTVEAAGVRGALARAGSTVRPPIALTDDLGGGIVERTYSKDLTRKAVQTWRDAGREPLTDSAGKVVTVTQRGREVPVLKPRNSAEQAHLAKGRGDFEAGRANSRERLVRDIAGHDAKIKGVRGRAARDIVAMVAEGTVTSAEHLATDLHARLSHLREQVQHPENYRHPGELAKARAEIATIEKVLNSPKALARAQDIAAAGIEHGRRQVLADAENAKAGLGDAAQLKRARLMVTAQAHMGARHFTVEEHAAAETSARAAGDHALADAVSGRHPQKLAAHRSAQSRVADARSRAQVAAAQQARAHGLIKRMTGAHGVRRGQEAQHGPVAVYHVAGQRFTTRKEAAAALRAARTPEARAAAIAERPHPARSSEIPTVEKLSANLRPGKPGVSIEDEHVAKRYRGGEFAGWGDPIPGSKSVVLRDGQGNVRGVLSMTLDHKGKPDVLEVAVDPALRGKGIASKLYAAATKAGYDVEHASGEGGLTEAGAALRHKRQTQPRIERVATSAAEAKRVGEMSKARRAAGAATRRRRAAERDLRLAQHDLRRNPLPEAQAGLRHADGQFLSNQHIEDFLKSRGRDPQTVAYLPHRSDVVGGSAFHAQHRPGTRPNLDKGETRTGAAYAKGSQGTTANLLREQGVRQKVQLAKAQSLDRGIEAHGMRHPAWAKAARGDQLTAFERRVVEQGGYFTGKEAAEIIDRSAREGLTGKRHETLVAVRAYPAKLDEETAKIVRDDLQGPAGMESLSQRLLNSRFLSEEELQSGRARNVVLMSAPYVNRLVGHLKPTSTPGRFAQVFNRAFRYAVLPQPRWLTGNFVEPFIIRLTTVGSGLNVFGLAIDLIAASKGLKVLERSGNPQVRAVAQEIRAQQFGGLFIGGRGAGNYRGLSDFPMLDAGAQAAYGRMVARMPSTQQMAQMTGMLLKGGAKAILAPLETFMRVNRVIDQTAQRAAFGHHLRADIQQFTGSWLDTVKLGQKAVEEAAHGLVNTEAQHRFMAAQHELLGKYEGFSPTMRGIVQGPAPFIPWALNAARFVYWTMPAHRTAQTALLVKVNDVMAKDWQDLHADLPPGGLKLAIPNGKGGWIDIARYTQYGLTGPVVEGDSRSLTSQFYPQVAGAQAAIEGQDPFGRSLQMSTGQPPNFGQKLLIALNNLGEATIPYASTARRLQEHGQTAYSDSTLISPKTKPGTGHGMSAARRVFDPLRPTYLGAESVTAPAPKAGPVSRRDALLARRAALLQARAGQSGRTQALLERRAQLLARRP